MKKVVCLIVALLSATIFAFALTACGEHTCEFSDKWSYDGEKHWRACTNEKCVNISEEDFHDLTETTDENGAVTFSCSVCGYSVTDDKSHEHTYGDVYEKNDKSHYLACKTEGCQIKKDYKRHTFGNPEETFTDKSITRKYVCTICGYEKTVTIDAESVIESAEKWNLLFENVKYKNYSLVIDYTYGGTGKVHNEAYITENGAYIKMSGFEEEAYMIKNEQGTFDNYGKGEDNKWVLLDNKSDFAYKDICAQTELRYNFKDDFDKFSYNSEDGVYYCAEEVETENYRVKSSGELEEIGTLICSNVKIRVADGKLIYIEADYVVGEIKIGQATKDNSLKGHFKYYNVGSTEVTLAAEVLKDLAETSKDEADDSSAIVLSEAEWKAAMSFDGDFSYLSAMKYPDFSFENETIIYGNIVKQTSDSEEAYFEKDGDKYYEYRQKDGAWEKTESDGSYFLSCRTTNGDPFIDNFSAFTFNGVDEYTCSSLKYTLEVAGETITMTMTDVVIKVNADKKVVRIDFTNQPLRAGVPAYSACVTFDYILKPVTLPTVAE